MFVRAGVLLCALIFCLFLFISCGGGSDSVTGDINAEPQGVTADATTGSVTGYVYSLDVKSSSPDGLVVLDVEMPSEIQGYSPVSGIQVSLMSDPRISGVTASNGYFKLDNVPYSQIGDLTILEASGSGFSSIIFFSMSNIRSSSSDIVSLYVLPSAATVLTGRIIQFKCYGEDSSNSLVNPTSVEWQVEGGIGTIYSNGVFVATAVGPGKITVSAGELKEEIDIEVISNDAVGDLVGTVTYSDGTSAGGLFVTADVISWASETDASGSYLLASVPSGVRCIKVISNGDIIWEDNTIIVQGQQNLIDITLDTAPPSPAITSLVPSTAVLGADVSITGYNFGPSHGDSFVILNGQSVDIQVWSNNLITFTVPPDASTGPVIVNTGEESNSVNLIVIEAESDPNSPYKAELVYQSSELTVERYSRVEMRADFKNVGSIDWDPDVVFLGTSNPYNRITHLFVNSSWVSQYRLKMKQTEPVPPGGTAEFIFQASPDVDSDSGLQYFELRADSTYDGEGAQWFGSDGAVAIQVNVVEPFTYAAEPVSSPSPLSLQRGVQQTITITYKNTGNIAWSPDVVHLSTTDSYVSPLYIEGSPWISNNRIIMAQTEVVQIGENADFTFPVILNVPEDDGYISGTVESFELVAEGEYEGHPGVWFGDSSVINITVNVSD